YFVLTGGAAYPARKLEDLPELWRRPLLPPSAHAEGIPPALDRLVLSMLSLSPLGRPSTAAEVIDQLGAVGERRPSGEAGTWRGDLSRGALVGRQSRVALLRERVAKTAGGSGRAIAIQGRSGMGKTRLLKELGLEAQLVGSVVVNANGSEGAFGPWGVV